MIMFEQVSEERDRLNLSPKPPLLVKIAPDLTAQDKQDITDVVLNKQVSVFQTDPKLILT